MTIGKLRYLIQDLPDDAVIIGYEEDHSYRQIWARVDNVIDEGGGCYCLDYGESTDFVDGKRIKALICE